MGAMNCVDSTGLIKTADLGLPENLEKLNYLVGKIAGKEVSYCAGNCFFVNILDRIDGLPEGRSRYHPITNTNQCLEATPLCDVLAHMRGSDAEYQASVSGNPFFVSGYSKTELIARCLALVYSKHGYTVPISEFD